jgi:hypothetical protein
VYAVKIRDFRLLRQRITDFCATVDPNIGKNLHKHGKAAEKMRRVSG